MIHADAVMAAAGNWTGLYSALFTNSQQFHGFEISDPFSVLSKPYFASSL